MNLMLVGHIHDDVDALFGRWSMCLRKAYGNKRQGNVREKFGEGCNQKSITSIKGIHETVKVADE
jgi:hypothetical protein